MIVELLVAATVGVSFANTWMCVLFTLGAAAEGVQASKAFIVGRFVGVVSLGLLIASLRLALQEQMPLVLGAFGVLSIVFALLVLGRQCLERSAARSAEAKGCDTCAHCGHSHDDGGEEGAATQATDLFRHRCSCGLFSPIGSSCDHDHHHDGCSSWSPRSKDSDSQGRRYSVGYGLALGLFRGATPCAKMLLLAPLLIASELPMALLVVVVYAATSTVYPVIGLMSARILSNIKGHSLLIRAAGATIILIIGIYSILKAVLWDPGAPCQQ